MEQNRDFKGVWIVRDVWLDKRLNALEKVILTEIDSLDNGERGCYASNKYLAEFCQCSETKVSTAVSKLVKLGYLRVQSFDGRQRTLKSCLLNFERLNLNNCDSDIKNLKENNKENNSVSNKEKKERKNSFDSIIDAYTEDSEIKELLGEWLKVRKAKRSAMTDRAIQMNIAKLDALAKESNMTVKTYLGEVICRGWAAFYPINNYSKKQETKAPSERDDSLDDIF